MRLLVAAMLLTCFSGCKKDNEGKESNESTVTPREATVSTMQMDICLMLSRMNLTMAVHNALKTEYAQHVERSISSDSLYDIIAAHTGSIL